MTDKKQSKEVHLPSKKSANIKVSTSYAWLVWLPAALFYCYQFFLRVAPSVLSDDLMRDFSINATTFGTLVGFYFYGYAVMQIPLGILMDSFGPRRLLTMVAFLCALGTGIFGFASNIYVAEIGRLLVGMGAACGFLGSMKVGTLWFNRKKLPLISGMTLILGTIGGMSASGPLSLLNIALGGWRKSFFMLASIGILVSIFAWVQVKDHGPYKDDQKHSSIFKGLKLIIRLKQIWIMAIFGFFMYIGLSALPDSWGPSFLVNTYGLSEHTAGSLISLIYLGVAIGGFVYPALTHRWHDNMHLLVMSCPLIAGILSAIIIFIPGIPLSLLSILLTITGVSIGGHILYFSVACSHVPVWASGVTIGFVNMITMISGVVFPKLIGYLLDLSWDGTISNGLHVFTPHGYMVALSIVPISLMVAFILSLFIRMGKHHTEEI